MESALEGSTASDPSYPRLVKGLQLDEVGRERQMQRQGAQRAEALAEGSVELAQAMRVAGAAAKLTQLPMWRMRVCVQGK